MPTFGELPEPTPAEPVIETETVTTTEKTATVEAEPVQPWQRVLRTIFQALVILIPLVNLVAIAVVSYLNEQTNLDIPGTVFVVLNAIVAGTAFVMGLVARIMAVPGVNGILSKIGLGITK